jgi:hypothetical protein
MGWCEAKQQCPCAKCVANLPTTSIIAERARRRHMKRYGLPASALQNEEFVQPEEIGVPEILRDEVKAPPARPVLTSHEVDYVAFGKDTVLLVVNHGIPWKSAELLIKCMNTHVYGRVLDKKLPATVYQLRRLTQCSPGNAKLFHVCPVCDFVYVGDSPVCDPCGRPPRRRVPRQLIVNDIAVTMRQMFGVRQLAEAFEYAYHRVPGDGDVWDGRVLRDVPRGTFADK